MFLNKLRQFMTSSQVSRDEWVVVFLDKNDFRLSAMKKRLAEQSIQTHVEKGKAIYVLQSDLESAKAIVAEWVN